MLLSFLELPGPRVLARTERADPQRGQRCPTPSREKGPSPPSQGIHRELSSPPGPGTQPPIFAAEFREGHGGPEATQPSGVHGSLWPSPSSSAPPYPLGGRTQTQPSQRAPPVPTPPLPLGHIFPDNVSCEVSEGTFQVAFQDTFILEVERNESVKTKVSDVRNARGTSPQ